MNAEDLVNNTERELFSWEEVADLNLRKVLKAVEKEILSCPKGQSIKRTMKNKYKQQIEREFKGQLKLGDFV